jgi:hypothetical protein
MRIKKYATLRYGVSEINVPVLVPYLYGVEVGQYELD